MFERWYICDGCAETHAPPVWASVVEGGRVDACDVCGRDSSVTVFRIKGGF